MIIDDVSIAFGSAWPYKDFLAGIEAPRIGYPTAAQALIDTLVMVGLQHPPLAALPP